MAKMFCGCCHRYGIYWKNLGGLIPYTLCPHCGGKNCQEPEPEPEEDDEEQDDDEEAQA